MWAGLHQRSRNWKRSCPMSKTVMDTILLAGMVGVAFLANYTYLMS